MKVIISTSLLITSFFASAQIPFNNHKDVQNIQSCFNYKTGTYDEFINQAVNELKSSLGKLASRMTPQMYKKSLTADTYQYLMTTYNCYTYENDSC